jgi:hypothetical protein
MGLLGVGSASACARAIPKVILAANFFDGEKSAIFFSTAKFLPKFLQCVIF